MQLIKRCQKLGFTLSHRSKLSLLDIVGGHFNDEAVKLVKQGKQMQGTGDNWDFRIKAHDMRSNNQNKDVHYFASNLVFERVPVPEKLSDVTPKRNIRTLPNSFFLLSDQEATKLRENFKVLVARVFVDVIAFLHFLKQVVPKHIHHPYLKETAQKSVIVPMPMQMKDEKNYSDVVDILSFYEDSLEEVYVKAGIAQVPTATTSNMNPLSNGTETTMPMTHSRPDQPSAHSVKYDKADHMNGVSVPFGGDQMTRVRFAGAKDLRAGGHTAKDRFDHCSPFIGELWHTKMAFLQVKKSSLILYMILTTLTKMTYFYSTIYPGKWDSSKWVLFPLD